MADLAQKKPDDEIENLFGPEKTRDFLDVKTEMILPDDLTFKTEVVSVSEMQRQLADKKKQIQKMNKEVDDLESLISQEIIDPINTSISSNISNLSMNLLDKSGQEKNSSDLSENLLENTGLENNNLVTSAGTEDNPISLTDEEKDNVNELNIHENEAVVGQQFWETNSRYEVDLTDANPGTFRSLSESPPHISGIEIHTENSVKTLVLIPRKSVSFISPESSDSSDSDDHFHKQFTRQLRPKLPFTQKTILTKTRENNGSTSISANVTLNRKTPNAENKTRLSQSKFLLDRLYLPLQLIHQFLES